ncbi:MAG: hypothetical protein WCT29_01075 [Candidatus Paceibacterota bacterium]|jgi:hypothetical protein
MKNSVLNSPRLTELKKRRRRAFLNRFLVYVVLFVGVVALSAYLSRLPGINIETIETEGNNIVDSQVITSLVENEMAGKYLWLFPKTNVLFYPKDRIKEVLAQEERRLGEITLSVKNNRVLHIKVSEREPLYTWCGESLPISGGESSKCFFLDKEGYIFDEAPYFSGDVYFKFYGAKGVTVLKPTGSYFAQENFANLTQFKEAVRELKLNPVALYLKEDGDVELFLSSTVNPEPMILFRADANTEDLSENLAAALGTEPLKTKMEKQYPKLEYLDLRFDNKVYSKFSPQ